MYITNTSQFKNVVVADPTYFQINFLAFKIRNLFQNANEGKIQTLCSSLVLGAEDQPVTQELTMANNSIKRFFVQTGVIESQQEDMLVSIQAALTESFAEVAKLNNN
jgi:hypothetical protein